MGYGRLGKHEPEPSQPEPLTGQPDYNMSPPRTTKRTKLKLLLFFSFAFILASAVSVSLLIKFRTRGSDESEAAIRARPTIAISRTCSRTRYPTLCVNSLLDFPGSHAASESQLAHITMNVTLQRLGKALYFSSAISHFEMSSLVRSAYEDCLELLADSVSHLSRSLNSAGSTQDVLTWLSAALTNQDTCTDGLEEVRGPVRNVMEERLRDLGELVSNCLAIYAAASGGRNEDFSGVPIGNRRRMLAAGGSSGGVPRWLSRRERALLDMPVAAIQADIVVSKDGNGSVKTIAEAIKKAPEYSTRRTIIYVKAGRYEEDNLKVGRKKTNLMFIGDGKGKTIISGGKSIFDNMTTFHTASFAATGSGFIARDMTFENWAGPSKHQAVALRVGADHAVVYRCNIIGYQDTLYVHSQRQFFRECDIYGTVDFIFGNAAVVFQNCSIYARKGLPGQKNTVTAQNRKDPNQNTGISIHACRIMATSDLMPMKGNYSTFLGRPWKPYSRTVVMLSHIGDHVHPRGWLEWNTSNFALDTLYYGEYLNYGPGSALSQRVKWLGYRVINSTVEASQFTVAQFIFGSSWLPSTGVAFLAGLSL
ncbi:probable pectinesterase/pectinesterase inhibitor 34 [Actinidia eriantha]|uniref:probable pectinesterase/pectinesterase inhibitor 34 n=1 Tax=Actinidia eriantha TaxID=165200 RepID=UPI00258993BA|nr:probable pectinesterase/pectinesterase inhibitor 34 [Actinidia eriantha]